MNVDGSVVSQPERVTLMLNFKSLKQFMQVRASRNGGFFCLGTYNMNMGASETSNKILVRLQRKAGVPGLLDVLSERLSPSELTSSMLEVYRRQAQNAHWRKS